MNSNQMKNIIVLKDLPSNLIDEAFIILKDNKKVKMIEQIERKNNNKIETEKSGEYIIKEAEMVISNYLSKIEAEKTVKTHLIKKIENKYNRLKIVSIILGIVVVLNSILIL